MTKRILIAGFAACLTVLAIANPADACHHRRSRRGCGCGGGGGGGGYSNCGGTYYDQGKGIYQDGSGAGPSAPAPPPPPPAPRPA